MQSRAAAAAAAAAASMFTIQLSWRRDHKRAKAGNPQLVLLGKTLIYIFSILFGTFPDRIFEKYTLIIKKSVSHCMLSLRLRDLLLYLLLHFFSLELLVGQKGDAKLEHEEERNIFHKLFKCFMIFNETTAVH